MPDLIDFLLAQYSQPNLGDASTPWQTFLEGLRKNHGPERAEAAKQGILDFAAYAKQFMLQNALQDISYSDGSQVLNFGLHSAAWPNNDPVEQAAPVVSFSSHNARRIDAAGAVPVTSLHDSQSEEKPAAAVLPL